MQKNLEKHFSFEIRRVIEYSAFFVGEQPIDITATLKLFNRGTLVRMAAVLSHHYGNMCVPDNERTLFSDISKKHIPYLNKLFSSYYSSLGLRPDQKVQVTTYRTGLELWRHIFAIRTDEFTDEVDDSDEELLLFKVILSINEKIVSFNSRKEQYKYDELLFLNGFLTNDSNNYDFKAVMQPQVYYFRQLVDYIPSNEVLTKASEHLLHGWGVDSWMQYYNTIVALAYDTDQYITEHAKGVPIIPSDWMKNNPEKGLVSLSLIEHLSLEEEAYIPYEDEVAKQNELNIDYRKFRSKPFVKLKDGSGYVVINNQLLCERLFNSLYFDFQPLINNKKGSFGFFDYNKCFIEKALFRTTFFNCIPTNCYTFPKRGSDDLQEERHEPDFYARTKKGDLIIVECKAIKMNGECRDDGDYVRLLDELHEKIVMKTRNLDKNRKAHKGAAEPMGVGQLVHHIDSIDADIFQWDTNIPDEVCYYPTLVFEDVKLVQKGILSLVNRWFYEELKKKNELVISDAFMPIMVVSINTLYLYDDLLRKRGLTRVIDSFVRENTRYDAKTGQYDIPAMADFDEYLRFNTFNKTNDIANWLNKQRNKK